MREMIKRSLVLIIGIYAAFLSTNNAYSQDVQCLENLRRARTVYDEGRLHEILDVIGESCLTGNQLNEEEKSEAYRLLILSYIYQDLPDKADETMLALLRTNPRFKINRDTDPNELINIYDSFRTDPIFRYGGKGGINSTLANITNTYTISNALQANGNYTKNLSITVYGFIEKDFLDKKLILRAEPHVALHKMTYKASAFPLDEDQSTLSTTWENVERQTWLGLNILGRYGILKNWSTGKKINPHLILGPSFQYLLNSSLSATTNIINEGSISGADLDLVEEQIRKKINLSGIVGIGFVFPQRTYAIFTDITYHYGFLNITDKHTSSELTFKYAAAMSNMSISSINLSIGGMLNQYSPKKLAH